jgi:hypothetical protein
VLSSNNAETLPTTKNDRPLISKRALKIKSAHLVGIKKCTFKLLKNDKLQNAYFSGACTCLEHIICIVSGGQPFKYNLGAGVDVCGKTRVPVSKAL